MTDLFDTPDCDPLTIARKLDKIGEEARIRMRKGTGYCTIEHKAAKLLRWYVSRGEGTRVAKQSEKLISEALRDKDAALRAAWYADSKFKGAKADLSNAIDCLRWWRRMAFVATCLFVASTGFLTFVVLL